MSERIGGANPLDEVSFGDEASEFLETVLPKQERVTAFQLLLVALSIYVLVALLLERTAHLSPGTIRILRWSDTAICIVFLADFFARLIAAPNKLGYLRRQPKGACWVSCSP